jgi:hypothetical protein
VDLEELAEALEGDPLDPTGGGIIDLDTGEVFVECVIEYLRDDEGVDLYETRERILGIDRLGSRAAYRDMVDYIESLADEHLAELLTVAVQRARRVPSVQGRPRRADRNARALLRVRRGAQTSARR